MAEPVSGKSAEFSRVGEASEREGAGRGATSTSIEAQKSAAAAAAAAAAADEWVKHRDQHGLPPTAPRAFSERVIPDETPYVKLPVLPKLDQAFQFQQADALVAHLKKYQAAISEVDSISHVGLKETLTLVGDFCKTARWGNVREVLREVERIMQPLSDKELGRLGAKPELTSIFSEIAGQLKSNDSKKFVEDEKGFFGRIWNSLTVLFNSQEDREEHDIDNDFSQLASRLNKSLPNSAPQSTVHESSPAGDPRGAGG